MLPLQLLRVPPSWPGLIEARTVFPPDFPGFDGHFPGRPILPGFLQVQLALDVLHTVFPQAGDIEQVVVAKFSRALAPGQEVRIVLDSTEGRRWVATLYAAGVVASTFELLLDGPEGCPQKS